MYDNKVSRMVSIWSSQSIPDLVLTFKKNACIYEFLLVFFQNNQGEIMTLEELVAKRDAWSKAEDAVMKGQNYSIEGLSVSRVDVEKIQRSISRYNKLINMHKRKAATGRTTGRAVWS